MSSSLRSPRQRKLREILIDARKSAKLTQAELAQRLQKPQSFVAKYELGERRVDVVEFVAIATALGPEPAYFLAGYIDMCKSEEI